MYFFFNFFQAYLKKSVALNLTNMQSSGVVQGRKWWVGRVVNCPPSFWQKRSRQPAAARHNMPHYWLPTQYLVTSYAPVVDIIIWRSSRKSALKLSVISSEQLPYEWCLRKNICSNLLILDSTLMQIHIQKFCLGIEEQKESGGRRR